VTVRGTASKTRASANRARPQLDPESILEAALRLAAASSEPLTVRRLGAELGADPTSIYRHFRDKDELVRAMIDRMIGMSIPRVDTSADWRTRLTTLADVTLELCLAHPTIGAEAATQTTGGPHEATAVDIIIQAMADAGLRTSDQVRYYAVYSSYVLAFCSAEASNTLLAARLGDDPEDIRWLAGSAALTRRGHPALVALRPQLEALRTTEIYQVAVQVILDAVEAKARD
jgi:AcrR family transcriptional regulator